MAKVSIRFDTLKVLLLRAIQKTNIVHLSTKIGCHPDPESYRDEIRCLLNWLPIYNLYEIGYVTYSIGIKYR
jgi:hypothetical protein